jgi:hypothetical protein
MIEPGRPRTRVASRVVALAAGAAVAVAAGAGLAGPATAADERPSIEQRTSVEERPSDEEHTERLAQTRLCDPTGCYLAWSVVDSDRDSVADADELVADTDPHAGDSRPALARLVELIQARRLPSFEAGLSTLIALPADAVAARTRRDDPLGALPTHTRGDTLSRLGISAQLLAERGIDLDRDGLTLGLDGRRTHDSGPGVRVAGIDARLISSGPDPEAESHGGVNRDDGMMRIFHDGASETTKDHGKGEATVERTNPDGSPGPTTQSRDRMDGDVAVHEEKTTETDENGNVTGVVYVTDHIYPDGSGSTLTEGTFFARDADGNVVGQLKAEWVQFRSPDGSVTWGAATTSECAGDGTGCHEVATGFEPENDYVDPEYADGPLVSLEVFRHTLLIRRATTTVVAGWTAPALDGGPRDPNDPSVIALVDAELGAVVQVQPNLATEAQPEGHPDLPSPRDAAPRGSGGGPCQTLCGG